MKFSFNLLNSSEKMLNRKNTHTVMNGKLSTKRKKLNERREKNETQQESKLQRKWEEN